jgi:uncharacterized protein YprB with RNaseH-like and TPR domain
VLARSFLFLPGIGPVREVRLWRRGVDSWASYRDQPRVQGIRPRVKAQHDEILAIAESSLGKAPHFFARLLPQPEHWRCFDAFGSDVAYVDIETTGDRENLVTVVGVRRGGKDRAFVRHVREGESGDVAAAGGEPYTPDAVADALAGASCLVTFNGASFDLPVLVNEGVRLPAVPHVDLRVVCARVGLTGGLKKIEDTLGFGRTGELAGLSGWDAVKLWRRWADRSDAEALRTLVAYNVADFANLEPLARLAVDRLTAQTLAGAARQARFIPGASPAPVAGP